MPSQIFAMGIFFFLFEDMFGNGHTSKNHYILILNKTWNAACKFRTIQLEQLGVVNFPDFCGNATTVIFNISILDSHRLHT